MKRKKVKPMNTGAAFKTAYNTLLAESDALIAELRASVQSKETELVRLREKVQKQATEIRELIYEKDTASEHAYKSAHADFEKQMQQLYQALHAKDAEILRVVTLHSSSMSELKKLREDCERFKTEQLLKGGKP